MPSYTNRGDRTDYKRHDSTRRVLTNGRDLESLETALTGLKPTLAASRAASKKGGAFMDARTAAHLKSAKARRRKTRGPKTKTFIANSHSV
jgi:hypothetical protein